MNNNLNKSNKHVHHLNNSKLGNATVLTATLTTAANNRYFDGLLRLLSETLRILTKYCSQKPSKYRNLVKTCNQLVKKVKKYGFSDRTQVV